jgi:adenylate cyclase class 2
MNIEIEAKLKVESLEDIKSKLVELGAEFLAEQLQRDYYFDDKDRTLTKTDKCLRLRRERVDKHVVSLSNPKERFILTYKGAKEKDQFKKRQEIEIEIKDPDSTEKMLIALGYNRVLVVEKKRRTWRYRNCVVALDEVPLLGEFVEIEGPDDEKISDVQNELALANLWHIPESYAGLMEQKFRTNEERETR